MVSEDLEFYHDQTGLMVGKAPFLAAIKQNMQVRSSVAYWGRHSGGGRPVEGEGWAVEIGIHAFHHPNEPDNVGDAGSDDLA